jgi:hypothetical protein
MSYYEKNKDKIKANTLAYYHLHAEKRKLDFRRYDLLSKIEVLKFYGGGKIQCCLCPETRLGALHIDHQNGGGKRHRLIINKKGGGAFYRWLKKSGFPPGYRTLCSNCNWKEHLRLKRLSISDAAVKARERWAK